MFRKMWLKDGRKKSPNCTEKESKEWIYVFYISKFLFESGGVLGIIAGLEQQAAVKTD